jgi:hypothetical protein
LLVATSYQRRAISTFSSDIAYAVSRGPAGQRFCAARSQSERTGDLKKGWNVERRLGQLRLPAANRVFHGLRLGDQIIASSASIYWKRYARLTRPSP